MDKSRRDGCVFSSRPYGTRFCSTTPAINRWAINGRPYGTRSPPPIQLISLSDKPKRNSLDSISLKPLCFEIDLHLKGGNLKIRMLCLGIDDRGCGSHLKGRGNLKNQPGLFNLLYQLVGLEKRMPLSTVRSRLSRRPRAGRRCPIANFRVETKQIQQARQWPPLRLCRL
jgi:hypothetical protein